MSYANSTAGYLIVNMWTIYGSLRHHGDQSSARAAKLIETVEGEENLMVKVMETAVQAAEAIDALVDWNEYSNGIFDFEESDRFDCSSIAATLWHQVVVDDQDANLVIFNWLSDHDIPLKSQEAA